MKRILIAAALTVALLGTGAPVKAPMTVTARVLDYQGGYIFFTTGDGFRVSPDVQILDYRTHAPAHEQPRVRQYARVTFDASGTVTKIELSNEKLPAEGDLGSLRAYAVALSTPAPNPELAPQLGLGCHVEGGKRVTVTFSIQVPPSTAVNDLVFMTTDQSGWNPQAYRLERVDALHYRTTLRLLSGTILKYLFDRGSAQSIQRGEDGLEPSPYTLCVGDSDAQAIGKVVYRWGDEGSSGNLPVPQTMPTPYNPAPFPNLPTPKPRSAQ